MVVISNFLECFLDNTMQSDSREGIAHPQEEFKGGDVTITVSSPPFGRKLHASLTVLTMPHKVGHIISILGMNKLKEFSPLHKKRERKSRAKEENWRIQMATASLVLAMAFIVQNRKLLTLSSEYFISCVLLDPVLLGNSLLSGDTFW